MDGDDEEQNQQRRQKREKQEASLSPLSHQQQQPQQQQAPPPSPLLSPPSPLRQQEQEEEEALLPPPLEQNDLGAQVSSRDRFGCPCVPCARVCVVNVQGQVWLPGPLTFQSEEYEQITRSVDVYIDDNCVNA